MPTYEELLQQANSPTVVSKPSATGGDSNLSSYDQLLQMAGGIPQSQIPTTQTTEDRSESFGYKLGQEIRSIFTKEGAQAAKTGVKAGALETGASILSAINSLLKTKGTLYSLPVKEKNTLTNWADTLRKKSIEIKDQELGDKTGGQKFVSGVAEFAPGTVLSSLIIPGSGQVKAGAKGLQLLSKLVKPVVGEIVESQLIYNPLEHEGENQIIARTNAAIDDVVSYGIFKGAAKTVKGVVKNLVIKPMKYAVENVTSKIFKKMETEVFDNFSSMISAGVNDVLDGDTIKLDRAAFLDVVTGRAPIDSNTREFFSTPEWKNIVAKYGTNFEDYPEVLRVNKPQTATDVVAGYGISGFLSAPKEDMYKRLANDIYDIAGKAARFSDNEVKGKSGELGLLFNFMDGLEGQYSIKVDRNKVADLIKDTTSYIRELDDYNLGITNAEMKQGTIDALVSANVYDNLRMLKNIMSLSKSDNYDGMIASYDKWARKSGTYASDELIEELRNIGFNIDGNDALAEMAADLPTKTALASLTKELKAPEKLDVDKMIREAITISERQIEAPRVIASSTLNKIANNELKNAIIPESEIIEKQTRASFSEAAEIEFEKAAEVSAEFNLDDIDSNFVSKSLFNMTALLDKSVPADEAFDNLPGYAYAILTQADNIASKPVMEEAFKKANILSKAISKGKAILFKNKALGSLFSAQNKMFSESTARVNAMFQFLDSSTQVLKIANKRIEEEIYQKVRPEMLDKFADAIEKQDFVDFTEAEMSAVKSWQSYASNMLKFTNILRENLGKNSIPEVENYFPRQIQDIIKQTMLDVANNEQMLTKIDSRAIYKRTLDNLNEAVHEKDIRKILPIYFNSSMVHINSLMKQATDKIARTRWMGDELEAFQSRMRQSSYLPSVEKEWSDVFTNLGRKIGNALQVGSETIGLKKKPEKILIAEETKEFLTSNKILSESPAIKEALEKGYFEIKKGDWGNVGAKMVGAPVYLSSTMQLILNASFTAMNMAQPLTQAPKVFGATSIPTTIKSWFKGYVMNTAAEIVGFNYANQEKNILKTLGYLGVKTSVYGDGTQMLDYLGKAGKGLMLNLTWTEKANRLTDTFIASDYFKKAIPDLSKEQNLRLAAEFSAAMNFISGKHTDPSIKSSYLGRMLYQFQQFPISDSVLTLNAWENVIRNDNPAAQAFLNIIGGIGDKDMYSKAVANIDELAPKSVDSLTGLMSSYFVALGSTLATVNLFNVIYAFVTGKEPVISKSRAEQVSKETVTPFSSSLSPLASLMTEPDTASLGTILDNFKTPSINAQVGMTNLFIAANQKIYAMATGDIIGMYSAEDKMNESMQMLIPVFQKRLKDFSDVVSSGNIYSTKDQTQVQYQLSKTKAESPLTVLVAGRSGLEDYEKTQELYKTTENITAKNDKAKQAFFNALNSKDPRDKERYMQAYYKLISEGAKRVTPQQYRENEEKKTKTLRERLLETVPKNQRYGLK